MIEEAVSELSHLDMNLYKNFNFITISPLMWDSFYIIFIV